MEYCLLNAFDKFDEISHHFSGKKILLFLDYDGTLTPIVSDPQQAHLSSMMRTQLEELKHHFITGIISGRSLEKVKNFIGINGIFYAGSHGFDISGPDETQIKHQVYSVIYAKS